MAARRRSTARSSAGRAAPKSRNSAQSSRDRREGKITIQCPSCATEYRIPEEHQDSQIKCKNCGRLFIPSKASKRTVRKKNDAQPFIMGGGILAAMIIGGLIISSGGEPPEKPKKDPVKTVDTSRSNPRRRDAEKWANAVTEGNKFELAALTDITAMAQFLELGVLDGTVAERDSTVVAALLESDKSAFLRQCYVTGTSLEKKFAEEDSGRVYLNLSVKKEFAKNWERGTSATGEYRLQFSMQGDRAKIGGWEVIAEAKNKAKPKGPRPSVHEDIGQAADVERTYNGEKVVVREAELKPLGHLEGTPKATQDKIDTLISQIVDLDGPGGQANRATLELRQIGKPAVPRLLNKLYETPIDTQDNVLRLRRVTMALEDLTHQRFGFNPSPITEGSNAANEQMRQSALKQWYGWWADNHWRKDWDKIGVEEEESLEIDDPNKRPEGSKSPIR